MKPPPAADPWGAPRPPADRQMSRGWFAVLAAVWLVVLAVSAWWGVARPTPTDRDQTTVAAARPVVDEAIARVGSAVVADANGVVAVSGFERIGACEVSVFRDGERYRRTLMAVVPPGTELEALNRVASALPVNFRPVVVRGDPARLTADAGYWVLLTGTVTGPGEIRFVADTGDCRSLGDLAPEPEVTRSGEWGSVLLSRLGLSEVSRTEALVSCMDGGSLVTSEIRATAFDGDLRDAIETPDGSVVLVNEPRLFAYRFPVRGQVAVRAHDDETIITSTTVCQ